MSADFVPSTVGSSRKDVMGAVTLCPSTATGCGLRCMALSVPRGHRSSLGLCLSRSAWLHPTLAAKTEKPWLILNTPSQIVPSPALRSLSEQVRCKYHFTSITHQMPIRLLRALSSAPDHTHVHLVPGNSLPEPPTPVAMRPRRLSFPGKPS